MTNGQNASDGLKAAGKHYSATVLAKAQSSTSCSFCWFVLALYPTLSGMTERDGQTYRTHLERSHGLCGEITA